MTARFAILENTSPFRPFTANFHTLSPELANFDDFVPIPAVSDVCLGKYSAPFAFSALNKLNPVVKDVGHVARLAELTGNRNAAVKYALCGIVI